MTPRSLADDSRRVVDELDKLLVDDEPDHWDDGTVRQRLGSIEQLEVALGALADRTGSDEAPDERFGALKRRLGELRDVVYRYAPAEGQSSAEARRAWDEFRARSRPAAAAI